MSIEEFIKIIKTRIPLLIICPLVFGGLAFAFSIVFMSNNYTSSVKVYILGYAQKTQKQLEEENLDTTGGGDFSLSSTVAGDLAALANSSKVKNKVSETLGIKNIGSYNLVVTKEKDSRMLTIKATGKNPETTADVVNATAKVCADVAVEQINVDAVNIIEEAQPATSPSGPNRKLITVAGAGIGLFFILVLIILKELLDTTIKSSEELKNLINYPVLSKLPFIKGIKKNNKKKKKHEKNDMQTFNHQDLKNSLSTLFANIRFSTLDDCNKTIVITSVGMDEGKSTIASNLALTISQAGQTCVLVDTDLRKHTLAKIMNINCKRGIYSILSGTSPIHEAIYSTEFSNLYFVDCEPDILNPADVIGSDRFSALIKYLKENFDYVILDTPPLISFVDGALIGSISDGTILVVREGKTKKQEIKNAVSQLKQANANILGTVLSFCTDTTESDYYYAYYNQEGKRVDTKNKSESIFKNDVDRSDITNNLNTWMEPKKGAHTSENTSYIDIQGSHQDNNGINIHKEDNIW